jgi:hypothetical protein
MAENEDLTPSERVLVEEWLSFWQKSVRDAGWTPFRRPKSVATEPNWRRRCAACAAEALLVVPVPAARPSPVRGTRLARCECIC